MQMRSCVLRGRAFCWVGRWGWNRQLSGNFSATFSVEGVGDWKREMPEMLDFAGVKLDHVNALHGQVVRIIKEWKSTSGKETPAAMQVIWDYERSIGKTAKIKTLLDMYKGL